MSFVKFKPVFGDLASDERFATMYAKMVDNVYRNPDVSEHMREVIGNR